MSITMLPRRNPALGIASTFNDFFEPWSEWFGDGVSGALLTLPAVNISEDKKCYYLELAAPGMYKDDFNIDIKGNLLTISAQKEERKETNENEYTRNEYNYSSFSRSFTLPDEVVDSKIEATYENGVLKLLLPKNGKNVLQNHKTITIK